MKNEIKVYKMGDSDFFLSKTMLHCWNVKSKMNRKKIFASNDSILEIPEYWIFCRAPRSVAAQLRTHEKKHGSYFWMGTSRPDRADAVQGEYSRDQIVPFVMKLTARALKEIAHYRMCRKAEKPTRDFLCELKLKIAEIEPCLAEEMVPLCVFRGGICTEFQSCKNRKGPEK